MDIDNQKINGRVVKNQQEYKDDTTYTDSIRKDSFTSFNEYARHTFGKKQAKNGLYILAEDRNYYISKYGQAFYDNQEKKGLYCSDVKEHDGKYSLIADNTILVGPDMKPTMDAPIFDTLAIKTLHSPCRMEDTIIYYKPYERKQIHDIIKKNSKIHTGVGNIGNDTDRIKPENLFFMDKFQYIPGSSTTSTNIKTQDGIRDRFKADVFTDKEYTVDDCKRKAFEENLKIFKREYVNYHYNNKTIEAIKNEYYNYYGLVSSGRRNVRYNKDGKLVGNCVLINTRFKRQGSAIVSVDNDVIKDINDESLVKHATPKLTYKGCYNNGTPSPLSEDKGYKTFNECAAISARASSASSGGTGQPKYFTLESPVLGDDDVVRGRCRLTEETNPEFRLKTYDRYGINDDACEKLDPNVEERLFGKKDGSAFALYSVAYPGSILTHGKDNFHIVNPENKTTQVKTRFYDVFSDIFQRKDGLLVGFGRMVGYNEGTQPSDVAALYRLDINECELFYTERDFNESGKAYFFDNRSNIYNIYTVNDDNLTVINTLSPSYRFLTKRNRIFRKTLNRLDDNMELVKKQIKTSLCENNIQTVTLHVVKEYEDIEQFESIYNKTEIKKTIDDYFKSKDGNVCKRESTDESDSLKDFYTTMKNLYIT